MSAGKASPFRAASVLPTLAFSCCAAAFAAGATTAAQAIAPAASNRWDAHRTSSGATVVRPRGAVAARAGSPERIALEFLEATLPALAPGPVELRLRRTRSSPLGAIVELDQQVHGMTVLGSEIRVVVDGAGAVRFASFAALERIAPLPAPAPWPALAPLETAAVAAAGREASQGALRIVSTELGYDRRTGGPACRFLVADDLGPFELVTVGAERGSVVDQRRLRHAVDIEGLVFNPNPMNTLNDPLLQDLDDACGAVPMASYFIGTVLADDPVAGLFQLAGPWARVVDLLPPTAPVATSTTFDGFNVCRSESEFEEFNAYFWVTLSAGYVDSLGHVLLNNPISIDAHVDSLLGPAFLGLPYELVPPGEASGLMVLTDDDVDSGEDADVILHEHSHAIFHGLRPIAFCKRGEPDAINEGTADYWQAVWSYNTSVDNGFDPECVAEWWSSGLGMPCLRRTDSPKIYPDDLTGEPHDDGEIWSAFLLDLAFQVGSFTDVDRILLAAVELAPDAPSFADMVQAMLDADSIIFAGLNAADISALAAGRGLDTPRPSEVSGRDSGVPLLVRKAAGGQVTILWEDLTAAVEGYNVYEGVIGLFEDLQDPASVFPFPACDVAAIVGPAGTLQLTGVPDFEDAFFLVTAHANGVQGPGGCYEVAHVCYERDPAAFTCLP